MAINVSNIVTALQAKQNLVTNDTDILEISKLLKAIINSNEELVSIVNISYVDGLGDALALKADTSTVSSHTGNTSNPHSVTKTQVGLGSVDNTSDASKPVSTATQTALNLKANQSTTYTKTEVDTNLATKVNNTGGSISGNLQINGTTYLQGGRKNFFVWGQGTMNGGYVHLKTNRLTNETQMHSVLFEGYDYGGSKPILCAVAWYNYGGSGTPINIGSTGSHTVSVYKSSDGYAVIVLTSSNYYVGFTLSQAWTNQGLSDITITASSSSASSSGVY